MAGADIRRFSVDRRGQAFNVLLGVVSGALLVLADTLLHPTIVLPLFVSELTDTYALIGLVPAIAAGAWFLPQVLASFVVRGRRRLPWATGASVVRTAAVTLLAYVGYRADGLTDAQLLRSFFICYLAYVLAGGFAASPTNDVLVKAVAGERRGRFFAQRALWSGVLAVAAGIVVRAVLGDGPAFPRNYTLLFLAAAAALTAATFFQARIREPIRLGGAAAGRGRGLRRADLFLADPNLRRFLLFRVVLSLAAVVDPFYVVYARRELGASGRVIGFYLLALVLARLLLGPLWRELGRRQGSKAVLQVSALVRLLVPLVALILPYVADTPLYQDRVEDDRLLTYGFAVVFVAYGAALAGQVQGNFAHLLAVAPNELHRGYTALTNILLAPVAFVTILGGAAIERYGFDRAFLVATLAGLVAVFASGALTDTHVRTRPTAEAWRLRRAQS